MQIHILGVGGYDGIGLPFNAFMIDGSTLVESPPDILQSLHREGINPLSINEIYISHTHGDHCFGLPFFLFHRWRRAGSAPGPRLIGPPELRAVAIELVELSIHPGHPLARWIEEACPFETVEPGGSTTLAGRSAEFYRMTHSKENLGFGLLEEGRLAFQYLPDSSWDASIAEYFRRGARAVLCDVNGTGGNNSVHMSVADIEGGLGPAFVARGTRIYGTHLSTGEERGSRFVEIVAPGMRLEL